MRDLSLSVWPIAVALAALGTLSCSSSGSAESVDGGPGIAITSPADGASISIATSTNVPVVFATTGFTLEPAGGCGAIGDGCGHVVVLIDGPACNAPGEIFDNLFPTAGGAPSPPTAIAGLATCASPAGAHTITLSLARDDHTPVSNGATASVSITASP